MAVVAHPLPRWRSLLDLSAVLAAGAALGAVTAVALVVLPILGDGAGLVDANLGTALARRLALPILTGVMLAAGVHAAAVWLQGGATPRKTVAVSLLAAAALERVWLAPTLFLAWSRVDRVTARPPGPVAEAQTLASQHGGMLVALALLATLAVVLSLRGRAAPPAGAMPTP